jgi:ubiquinone/menaquinone biosynthesis C-methylase UbiE
MNVHASNASIDQRTPFVAFWNDTLAPKFVKYRHILEGGLSQHSAEVMRYLDIPEGSQVLDVGCGFGDTAIDIANRIGRDGSVLGVDCCDDFLDVARHRPERMFTPNVRFENRDAERDLGEAEFDFVFSRFGTMFFANPVAGLRSMRKALKPGGRMAHIVWRCRADNPWLIAARNVVAGFLPAPGENSQSCGPGPFSMAEEDTTRAQMRSAGFSDISFCRIDAKVCVGRDIEDAVCFQLAIGPAGEIFRESGAIGESRRAEIAVALAELFEEVQAKNGGLWMDSSSWLITARAPDSDALQA